MLVVIFVLNLFAVFSFLYFGYLANEAMDKAGIGNLDHSNLYSEYAGYSFYASIILWGGSIFATLIKGKFNSKFAEYSIGSPAIFLIAGWFILLFLN